MRDPYHSARVRFKVARDRLLATQFQTVWSYWEGDEYPPERYNDCSPAYQRELLERFTPRYFATLGEDCRKHEYECREAGGVLHTMLRFKITDERQALMLWKLRRE